MSERPKVLVPVAVLKGESIPDGVPELLSQASVVLLGYHVIPEQTAAGQAKLQFEDRANNRLEEFERLFTDAGASVTSQLVFTHKKQQTIDRKIYENECDAVLVPSATVPVTDVIVAIRDTIGSDRMARLVGGLFSQRNIKITLTHVLKDDKDEEDAEILLEGVARKLEELGVESELIQLEVIESKRPLKALVSASESYDAVILGESDPSVVTYVFGMREEQVAEQFLAPVLIVQRERDEP